MSVEVRRYRRIEDFRHDAVRMADAGWNVTAQTEQSGGVRGAWVGVAVVMLVLGLLLWWGLLIVAALAFLAAFLDRRREMVVTYRYETPKTPGNP